MATLFLIPTPLGKRKENTVLPRYTLNIARGLRQFIVENIRTSQSFLQWIDHPLKPFEIEYRVLNKKTPDEEIFSFQKLLANGDLGMMSEAGAPAVADPGAKFIKMVHNAGHKVVPLVGPSSILLALMASGMNGQQFSFHGYLPFEDNRRINKIRELERDSFNSGYTQIFMETPFRNEVLFDSLLKTCKPESRLCIAVNLTMPDEEILSLPLYKWNKLEQLPVLSGRPAIFLLQAG